MKAARAAPNYMYRGVHQNILGMYMDSYGMHRDVPYVRMTNGGLISAPGLMIGGQAADE